MEKSYLRKYITAMRRWHDQNSKPEIFLRDVSSKELPEPGQEVVLWRNPVTS